MRSQSEAESLLEGNEFEVDSRRVLDLVTTTDCTAYDCEFAALAQALGTHLVTEDAQLLSAFPKLARALA